MNKLERRITDISKRYKLSHLGSNYTAVNIINHIYAKKRAKDKFVLSSGHAGLALYCVLEKYNNMDAERLLKKHGIHPNRDTLFGIECSTGSLGMGLGIAVGMAIAQPDIDIYCLITDGESYEGIIYEAANVKAKYNLVNLKVYCNWNGFTAYDVCPLRHIKLLQQLIPDITVVKTSVESYGLKGLSAHYCKLE